MRGKHIYHCPAGVGVARHFCCNLIFVMTFDSSAKVGYNGANLGVT